MNTLLCGSWEESAKIHVSETWKYMQVSPSSQDANAQIREHLDYMIDHYFNTDMVPSSAEWRTMAKLAIAASGHLDKIDTWSTLCDKQRDYGPNNIARFGQSGLLLRLHDKVARLENLVSNGKDAKNESLHDTYLDIVGYSIIGLMLLDDTFFNPLMTN